MSILLLWKRRQLLVAAAIVLPALVTAQSPERALFFPKLVAAAVERDGLPVRYDGRYQRIAYPNGDVPADIGVCTDEIIRVYRKVGVDLQKEVHEDMAANFAAYPKRWGMKKPDRNIDHRRVPNLEVFFARKGEVPPITTRAADFAPGDLVTWDLGGGVPHIGIVVNRYAPGARRYMVLHNIGAGPKIEDVLFSWKMTGHFRYYGPVRQMARTVVAAPVLRG